jgi:hypothetical protein
MTHLAKVLVALSIAALPSFAQTTFTPEPRQVTFCELSRDPALYNHQLVRITAFVAHGFEEFQIREPDCPTQGFSIWLMYGGKAESNTVYCCPGEAGREMRSEPLSIEGVQVPLFEDQIFSQFIDLLKKEPDTTIRTTVVGRFFSGNKVPDTSTRWRGYGHIGCCSLLVIQQVLSLEPHTRHDLDYTDEAGWYVDEGCKWNSEKNLRQVSIEDWNGTAELAIAEQRNAEGGQAWAFNDPQRVATESLKTLYPGQTPVLSTVQKTPARYVYRWKTGRKSIVVVVIRPYWLSFFATSSSVAWISTMIKEAECK